MIKCLHSYATGKVTDVEKAGRQIATYLYEPSIHLPVHPAFSHYNVIDYN